MRICKYLILHQSFSMYYVGTSLVAQTGKNPPAMLETQVRSLGQEDSLEKGLTTHSSILAWRIPWTEEPGGLSPWGCRVGWDWVTNISTFVYVSVQFSRSVVSDSLWPHGSQHARPPCPSPTPGDHSLMSVELVMPSSHLILCRPLLLLSPIPPSIRVFSNDSTLCMRWSNY